MRAAYRLTARLEEGELAELHHALREGDGARVLVKLFHSFTSDAAYAQKVAETARLLGAVDHAGFVPVLDLGVVRGRLALVREDVQGPSLGALLQRLGALGLQLPLPIALHLVVQLADTVQRAHDVGVLHGALTPGNVLLNSTGQARICDFGALAALMAVPTLRRALAPRGRASYRAPEVAAGEVPDALADVYSLGAIAYELLTLREASAPEGEERAPPTDVPAPSRLDRWIPPGVDGVILRALAPDASQRFRTCAELAGALRAQLAQTGGATQAEVQAFLAGAWADAPRPEQAGPPPFTEAFSLEPIAGAVLEPVRVERVAEHPRAPFSLGRPTAADVAEDAPEDAPTIEAPPAFEEYRPPPPAEERTQAVSPEALVESWEAPPAAAIPGRLPRRTVTSAFEASGTRVGRHPRVKLVEDFQGLPEPSADEVRRDTPPTRAAPALVATRPQPRKVVVPEVPEPEPLPRTAELVRPPELGPEESRHSLAAHFRAEERHLHDALDRQRRGRWVALGLAAVGLAVLVGMVALLREDSLPARPPPPRPQAQAQAEDPRLRAVSEAVQRSLHQQATPPAPAEGAAPAQEEGTTGRRAVGFLSVSSDVPASVFVDGRRLAQTPVVRHALKPGTHRIVVVAVRTRERRVREHTLRRGQHLEVEEHFTPPSADK